MTGGAEDGVDRIAFGSGQVVAFEVAVFLQVADDRLDTASSSHFPADGGRGNPCLPDRHITTLVEWADDLEAADPTAAFDIEVLEAVLPALNAALLASYSFSGEPARDPSLRGRQVDLVLTDRGGAVLVEMSRACACLLAVFFHGAAGIALVETANADLRDTMNAISGAIARRI